jgi:hypothetical protein
VRQTAHVTTRTTIVLSTYYENRPVGHTEIALRATAQAAGADAARAEADETAGSELEDEATA